MVVVMTEATAEAMADHMGKSRKVKAHLLVIRLYFLNLIKAADTEVAMEATAEVMEHHMGNN